MKTQHVRRWKTAAERATAEAEESTLGFKLMGVSGGVNNVGTATEIGYFESRIPHCGWCGSEPVSDTRYCSPGCRSNATMAGLNAVRS